MEVENDTWGEAGVLLWVLAAAGLPLPASSGSPAPPWPQLPVRVNVLPGCEQLAVPPSLQTPRGDGSTRATGAEPVRKGHPSSTHPVLHRENKAQKKGETC